VKHWAETAAILDRLSELAARGSRAVLATVIRISGSAYRRPGAKLLIEEDGITQGGVSGGCLESDVRAHALRILGGAENRMLHYDTGSDEETLWGLGLGCEGAVDVYLQRIDGGFMDGPGKQMRELLAAGVPFAAITFLHGRSEGKTLVFARGELAGSSGAPDVDRELAERFPPPLRLSLRRPSEGVAGLPLGISRKNFAVVQTHSLAHDRDWLRSLSGQPLAYLGLLGPRSRRELVLRALKWDGVELFAPVGLDIGADGPEQVAVSIVAELLAVNARREPTHLRARAGGIHAG